MGHWPNYLLVYMIYSTEIYSIPNQFQPRVQTSLFSSALDLKASRKDSGNTKKKLPSVDQRSCNFFLTFTDILLQDFWRGI